MELLERQAPIAHAERALRSVAAGGGRILLITGEPGIGKSAFVGHLMESSRDEVSFLVGHCDELVTPRPWGPFYDIARQSSGRLPDVLEGGAADLSSMLSAVLDEIAALGRPTGVVIEDIHWADSASLDLLTALSRRVAGLPVLLTLTYRGLERGHGTYTVVGSAPPDITDRIELEPLSHDAITALARGHRLDTDELYSSTGGNPFLVTELLAARDEGVPATVADAVLARTASLRPATRELLDLLSVMPNDVDVDLLDELDPDWVDRIEEAEHRRIVDAGSTVRFRHALVREAVEQSLSGPARRQHHLRVLFVLLERAAPLALIVHHARRAHATDILAECAPSAAREAAAAAAHRQAIDHYRLALEHSGSRPVGERADLHDELAHELWFDGQPAAALGHARDAITLLEQDGDDLRLGRAMRSAANLCEWAGDAPAAAELRRRALEVLEPLGTSADLAMLYGDLAVARTFSCEIDRALELGEQAIAVAEAVDDRHALAIALISAAFPMHWAHGRVDLWDRAYDVAGVEELEPATIARCNRAFISIERMDDKAAAVEIEDSLRFAADHEAAAAHTITRIYAARLRFEQGRWSEAAEELDAIRALPEFETYGPYIGSEHAYAAGRLAARAGSSAAQEQLEEAWRLARPFDQLSRLLQLAAAGAELATLEGRPADGGEWLRECAPVVDHPEWPWSAEIAYWLWRLGELDRPVPDVDHPRYHSMRGDWSAAAAAWERLGRPYEQAEALVESTDVGTRLEGLARLDDLGAAPLAAITRRSLRDAGVRSVPRGPQRSTRRNPAGLTTRQLDVLAQVADGLTNPEIAENLYVSVRTVESHVAAILQRLDVATRRDAARRAKELGVI